MKPNMFSLVKQNENGGVGLVLQAGGGVIPSSVDTNRFLGYPPITTPRGQPTLLPRTGTKMKPIQSPFQNQDGNHFDLKQVPYQPTTQNWKFMKTGFTRIADNSTWIANSVLEMSNKVQADGVPINPALIENEVAQDYRRHQVKQEIGRLIKSGRPEDLKKVEELMGQYFPNQIVEEKTGEMKHGLKNIKVSAEGHARAAAKNSQEIKDELTKLRLLGRVKGGSALVSGSSGGSSGSGSSNAGSSISSGQSSAISQDTEERLRKLEKLQEEKSETPSSIIGSKSGSLSSSRRGSTSTISSQTSGGSKASSEKSLESSNVGSSASSTNTEKRLERLSNKSSKSTELSRPPSVSERSVSLRLKEEREQESPNEARRRILTSKRRVSISDIISETTPELTKKIGDNLEKINQVFQDNLMDTRSKPTDDKIRNLISLAIELGIDIKNIPQLFDKDGVIKPYDLSKYMGGVLHKLTAEKLGKKFTREAMKSESRSGEEKTPDPIAQLMGNTDKDDISFVINQLNEKRKSRSKLPNNEVVKDYKNYIREYLSKFKLDNNSKEIQQIRLLATTIKLYEAGIPLQKNEIIEYSKKIKNQTRNVDKMFSDINKLISKSPMKPRIKRANSE